MPYINQDLRKEIQPELDALINKVNTFGDAAIDGVLNYTITVLVHKTLGKNSWRYSLIARAVGLFECAKLEFYRRLAAPYEDGAIEKNGDI